MLNILHDNSYGIIRPFPSIEFIIISCTSLNETSLGIHTLFYIKSYYKWKLTVTIYI